MSDSIGALRTLALVDDPNRPLPEPGLPLALGSIDADGRADYRLIEQAGEGQSARVYRAVVERMSDGTHRREVAVKLFRAMTEPAHFEAVRAEALRADRVRSPHIVRVFDVGLWDGRHPFVVQDFHESVHLEAWAEKAFAVGVPPPSVERCVRMTLDVARGLVEAHAHDLIHRDIAPRNILVCRDGVLRITDFGCAGFGEAASNATVVGTPGFMPPEQWRSGAQLKQSDLASLAGVLYWLLTGKLPYGSNREEILASHAAPAIAHARRSIELANSEVPPPVAKAVLSAMEPDLVARTAEVSDFIAELERWLASLAPRRRSERRQVLLLAALLAMVVTTVLLQRNDGAAERLPFENSASIAEWFGRSVDDPAADTLNRELQAWGVVEFNFARPLETRPVEAFELVREHEARLLAEPDPVRRLCMCLAAVTLAGRAGLLEDRDHWLARGADVMLDPGLTQSMAPVVVYRKRAWEGLHALATLDALTRGGSIALTECMTAREARLWQDCLTVGLVRIQPFPSVDAYLRPIPEGHPAMTAARDWIVRLQEAFPSLPDELATVDRAPPTVTDPGG